MNKTLDQVESGVAKAREKIDAIGEQAKEQYQNWKRVLSGALNDKQLIIALNLLFVFYVFFTTFNTIIGGNSKDENTTTCECPVGYGAYYRTLVIIAVMIWVLLFIAVTVWDAVRFWVYAVRSRRLHNANASSTEDRLDRAASFLSRTMDTVESGVRAAEKIPVRSMFTKTMGMVDDTLGVVDQGSKALRTVNSDFKNAKDKPLQSMLKSVDGAVTHRLESMCSDEVKDTGSDTPESEAATPSSSLFQKAKELAETGIKTLQQKPGEMMVSKVLDFVDDKAQINSAELIANSVELVEKVKEDPGQSMLAMSASVLSNAVANQGSEQPLLPDATPLNNGTSGSSGSALSAAVGLVNAGLQAVEQKPEDLLLSTAAEFVEDKAEANPMLAKSIDLATNAGMSKNPAKQLLRNSMELASQDPVLADTLTALDNASAPATSLLTNSLEAVQQHPTDTMLENIAPSVTEQATGLIDSAGLTIDENAVKSALGGVTKPVKFRKRKQKSECSRQLNKSDINTLKRLKHYEEFLWLQFYKVYSVGATADDDMEELPAFVDILGDNEDEVTSADDEVTPLINGKDEESENEIDSPLLDVPHQSRGAIPNIVIESEDADTDTNDFDAVEDFNTSTSEQRNFEATSAIGHNTNAQDKGDIKPAEPQSGFAFVNPLSEVSKERSTSPLKPVSKEVDFLESIMEFRPVGLYEEMNEDANPMMKVADASCARVSFFLYPMLVVGRLIAQLTLVPLLLFQIMDTYAIVCFTDDVYCRSVHNQYRLGLDKAATIFTFYCCLLISVLSSAILRWFPCSRHAREVGATCIM